MKEASFDLIHRCTTVTHRGVAILNPDEPVSKRLLDSFMRISRMKGWFDVCIHGCEPNEPFAYFSIHSPTDDGSIEKYRVTVQQLSRVIRYSERPTMSPIRLYTCHGSWRDEHGVPLAKQLAKSLNTEVLASNKSNANGLYGFIAIPPNWEPGKEKYTVFHPSDDPAEHKLKLKGSEKSIANGSADKQHHW
jgi:hypothetical protein